MSMNTSTEQVITRLSFITGSTMNSVTGLTSEYTEEYDITYGTFIPLIGPLDIVTLTIDGLDYDLTSRHEPFTIKCNTVAIKRMTLVNASSIVSGYTGTISSGTVATLQSQAAAVIAIGTKRKKTY